MTTLHLLLKVVRHFALLQSINLSKLSNEMITSNTFVIKYKVTSNRARQ